MGQLERIRRVTFWGLFAVSAFLSVTLYTGLVNALFDKGIMFVVSVAIEGLKVLALTWANTYLWQAFQTKSLYIEEKNMSVADLMSFKKKRKRAAGLFFVYALTATLSVSASFGYILQTVDRSETQDTTVSNESTQALLTKQIALKEKTISQNDKTIAQYNRALDLLDPNSKTYQSDYAKINGKITALTEINGNLLKEESPLNDQLQALQGKSAEVTAAAHPSMYKLMGNVLNVPDKSIRFILLILLSILIEIGIFVCSPHYHSMEDEDNTPDPQSSKKKEKKEISIPRIEPLEKTTNEPGFSQATPQEKVDFIREVYGENPPDYVMTQLKEALDAIPILPKEEKIIATPPPVAIEPEEEVPVRYPVPRKKLEIEKYIEVLFDNGGKTFLKDKVEACDEAGISRSNGAKYFQWLMTTKVNGYPIIEFRKESNNWYPNVTSEIAKSAAVRVFSKGEVNGSQSEVRRVREGGN